MPFDKAAPYTLARSFAVLTAGSLSDHFVQYKTVGTPDVAGIRARKFTTLLQGTRQMLRTANFRPLADATWAWAATPLGMNQQWDVVLVKTPPFPPDASINGTDYIAAPVTITPAPTLGVDNAIVEFGYDSALNCINRTGESCVAAATNNPYSYSVADAPIAGVPCASGCSMTMNLVPNSVAFWRVRYRDAANATLAVGFTQAIAAP